VYTWEVLADDIKQLTGVDCKQKRPETTPLRNSLSDDDDDDDKLY